MSRNPFLDPASQEEAETCNNLLQAPARTPSGHSTTDTATRALIVVAALRETGDDYELEPNDADRLWETAPAFSREGSRNVEVAAEAVGTLAVERALGIGPRDGN